MIHWGVSAGTHDASLSVVKDGEILFASHSERFSGIKNDKNLNPMLVDYAKNFFANLILFTGMKIHI